MKERSTDVYIDISTLDYMMGLHTPIHTLTVMPLYRHTRVHAHATSTHSFKIGFAAYKYKMTNILQVTTNSDYISYISLAFPFLCLFIYFVSDGN